MYSVGGTPYSYSITTQFNKNQRYNKYYYNIILDNGSEEWGQGGLKVGSVFIYLQVAEGGGHFPLGILLTYSLACHLCLQ